MMKRKGSIYCLLCLCALWLMASCGGNGAQMRQQVGVHAHGEHRALLHRFRAASAHEALAFIHVGALEKGVGERRRVVRVNESSG